MSMHEYGDMEENYSEYVPAAAEFGVHEGSNEFFSEVFAPDEDYIGPLERSDAPAEADEQLTPSERCVRALLDLREVQGGAGIANNTNNLYKVLYPTDPDADNTRTALSMAVPFPGTPAEDSGPITRVSVGFYPDSGESYDLLNITLSETPDGVMIEGRYHDAAYSVPLSSAEINALRADAEAIREQIVQITAARMQLGPLTEAADENGNRRFHVGDVISVLTGKYYSARRDIGITDLLEHMTGDTTMMSTQVVRFRAECLPTLEALYSELLQPHIAALQENTQDSELALLQELRRITDELGTSMLAVPRLDEHATMDFVNELVLDHGEEILKKLGTFDTRNIRPEDGNG